MATETNSGSLRSSLRSRPLEWNPAERAPRGQVAHVLRRGQQGRGAQPGRALLPPKAGPLRPEGPFWALLKGDLLGLPCPPSVLRLHGGSLGASPPPGRLPVSSYLFDGSGTKLSLEGRSATWIHIYLISKHMHVNR